MCRNFQKKSIQENWKSEDWKFAKKSLVVVDMPFPSCHLGIHKAIESAGEILKKSDCQAVKLEGGEEISQSIQRLIASGIPVMGHLGLTPQSIYKFGTYTVRAREEEEAEKLISDAKMLEEAGCFAIVLEKIPADLAAKVTASVNIPTIGIGAGSEVDGQVLVIHDLIGLTHEFNPRFLRRYLNLYEDITGAIENYVKDIKSGNFPNDEEQY